MLASSLKTKVRQNRMTLGPLLTMDFWPGYLEIFKSEGMDFVVLDMEHGLNCGSNRSGADRITQVGQALWHGDRNGRAGQVLDQSRVQFLHLL